MKMSSTLVVLLAIVSVVGGITIAKSEANKELKVFQDRAEKVERNLMMTCLGLSVLDSNLVEDEDYLKKSRTKVDSTLEVRVERQEQKALKYRNGYCNGS